MKTEVKRGEDDLYDRRLLDGLNYGLIKGALSPPITANAPGEDWLVVRPLSTGDYDRGFPELLGQLTKVGKMTKDDFLKRFYQMKSAGCYYITVIEDTRSGRLIGSASLVTELKFIHECALRGRLEDVVVNNTYRGKQLGKLIVVTVTILSKALGCYKMSLDCKDKLVKFYETLGYKCEPGNSNSMSIRFEETNNS